MLQRPRRPDGLPARPLKTCDFAGCCGTPVRLKIPCRLILGQGGAGRCVFAKSFDAVRGVEGDSGTFGQTQVERAKGATKRPSTGATDAQVCCADAAGEPVERQASWRTGRAPSGRSMSFLRRSWPLLELWNERRRSTQRGSVCGATNAEMRFGQAKIPWSRSSILRRQGLTRGRFRSRWSFVRHAPLAGNLRCGFSCGHPCCWSSA
jgi:hypothetical protein